MESASYHLDQAISSLVGQLTSGGTRTTWDKVKKRHIGRVALCMFSCLLMTISGTVALWAISARPTIGLAEILSISIASLYVATSYRIFAHCLQWRIYVLENEHMLWMRKLGYDEKSRLFPNASKERDFNIRIAPWYAAKRRQAHSLVLADKMFRLFLAGLLLATTLLAFLKACENGTGNLASMVLMSLFAKGVQASTAASIATACLAGVLFARMFTRDVAIMVGKR